VNVVAPVLSPGTSVQLSAVSKVKRCGASSLDYCGKSRVLAEGAGLEGHSSRHPQFRHSLVRHSCSGHIAHPCCSCKSKANCPASRCDRVFGRHGSFWVGPVWLAPGLKIVDQKICGRLLEPMCILRSLVFRDRCESC
jgi:hypothetical protein